MQRLFRALCCNANPTFTAISDCLPRSYEGLHPWDGFSEKTFKMGKDVDILPLLFLLQRWNIVVLERSEGMTSCLDELATSFAESGKKLES